MARDLKNLTPQALSRCLALTGLFGLIDGAFFQNAREHMQIGNLHLDAVIDLFVILPCACLCIVWWSRPYRLKFTLMLIPVILFTLWLTHLIGGAITLGHLWDDMLGVHALMYLVTAVACQLTLVAWHKASPYSIRTTDCLGCGYSLIGISRQTCPECGRDFTHEEMGIRPEDLNAPTHG